MFGLSVRLRMPDPGLIQSGSGSTDQRVSPRNIEEARGSRVVSTIYRCGASDAGLLTRLEFGVRSPESKNRIRGQGTAEGDKVQGTPARPGCPPGLRPRRGRDLRLPWLRQGIAIEEWNLKPASICGIFKRSLGTTPIRRSATFGSSATPDTGRRSAAAGLRTPDAFKSGSGPGGSRETHLETRWDG